MTMPFPLLKLPLIPLELIIEQLDFVVLVQLSMKISKFKRFLELLKLSVSTLRVCLTGRSYRISVLRNRKTSYIDAYGSVLVGTTTSDAARIQAERTFGSTAHIWKHGFNDMKVESDLAKLATLETITKHVLSFSKVAKCSLICNDVKTEIRNLFIWQLKTAWDQLQISRSDLVQISPEDLTFLLEGISVESLSLNVRCPGFKYQRPIRHPVFSIESPSWIDFDQFSLGPETITAEFSNQKVSVDVLNRLIKDWTEGKNPKLRAVKFEWEKYDQESFVMAREHQTRPPQPILPNRNVEQLKGLSINYLITYHFSSRSVYTAKLSVEKESDLNGIHLEDQV